MESILKELVELVGREIPAIKVTDEDYGQLEMLDDESRETYPLIFPAVLIDCPDVNWSNIQGNNQKGVANIRVKLAIDCYDDTHYSSGTLHKIKDRQSLLRSLHVLLQGHRIGTDQALNRTYSRFYTANHGIKVYENTYTVAVSEYIENETLKVSRPTVKIKTAAL